jgi:CMP-N,N'-diacetyllegionaminic acid synthase
VFKGSKVLGLVPARAGSKRLPQKNVLPFNGKPLIAWTIQAGLDSRYIDDVVVSTDSGEIRDTAARFGPDFVLERPEELGSDSASSVDVALHTIDALAVRGKRYEYLVLMQPTSPLREARHVDEAFALMAEKKARAITGVCKTDHPAAWLGKIPQSLSMDEFLAKGLLDRGRKDSDGEDYQINGAIYIVAITELQQSRTFFPRTGSYAYLMKREESIDIDTYPQFLVAEILQRNRNSGN